MKQLFQTKSRFVLLLLVLCCFSLSVSAESPGKKKTKGKEQTEYKGDVGTTITLVTSGTGETREEATKNALRNALEQTYGTFVSSNSKVVNDELISDEIVSISTGNIAKYEILSINDSNPVEVNTKVVVSISNLQSYAKNKGMSAELAGNTFAMNLKMEELNKKNQDVALKHLLEQTKIMSQNMFDYEISVGNPQKTSGDFPGVQVPVTIRIKANKNTLSYYDLFHNTLSSLAVQKKTGRDITLYPRHGIGIEGFKAFDDYGISYKLRGEARDHEPYNTLFEICNLIGRSVLRCEIVDNLGNVSGFIEQDNHVNLTEDYHTSNKLSFKYYSGGGDRSRHLMGYRDDYKGTFGEFPVSRLTRAGTRGFHFWMNAVKPKVGEKLYETRLF